MTSPKKELKVLPDIVEGANRRLDGSTRDLNPLS